MKKLLALLVAIVMMASLTAAFAEEAGTVTVTIANGDAVLPWAEVVLTDADEDGALTINDALISAHNLAYEGGAEAGYGSAVSEYGLGMTKLWGVENGGSYGYYVNNVPAWALTDPIQPGDHISAFVYTDLTTWSDVYTFFGEDTVEVEADTPVTLTLYAIGYDAEYNVVYAAVSGATIAVNGIALENAVTDEEGQVTLSFDTPDDYVVTASHQEAIIVPAVCIVTVK